ncbi:MAG: thioesterase [Chloroflexi bacterium]|nr:thioesterase [Chloroflexota bacterium]
MGLTKLPITYQKTIPKDYLDIMGHMNVMWYTHLFDEATFNFFSLVGMDKDYHTKSGFGAFALEQHTRYRAEVRALESVTMHSRALGISAKRFHFMHFMVKDETSVLAATAEFIGTHVDLGIRRTAQIPKNIHAAYEELTSQHSQLDWDAPTCGVMGA